MKGLGKLDKFGSRSRTEFTFSLVLHTYEVKGFIYSSAINFSYSFINLLPF